MQPLFDERRDHVRSRWTCIHERRVPTEPISPELVLVDPELARRVRPLATLPPALQRSPAPEIAPAPPRAPRSSHRYAPRRTPRLRTALAAVGAAAAVAVVTMATAAVPRADELPYVDAWSPPETSSAVPAGPDRVPPRPPSVTTKPDRAPNADAPPVRVERRLGWAPVPNADYYNVILWRDGERLRDYWPRRPRVVLNADELARLGARDASVVHWFVYPVALEAGRSVVGSVHATGSFKLPPRTATAR